MVALAGDAELDEGNIFEALLEGWKHDVRNLWWVIDYTARASTRSSPTASSAASTRCSR
jgi:pyruvate dehydrogenase complex dehydrogenase (E1) component